jgi:1-acyl-sn-glycerol-3-phosphate acyltransferase
VASCEAPIRDRRWARTPLARGARGLLIRGVFGSIVGTYSRRRVTGREHLRRLDGPVIFVANHSSHVDTPVLLLSLPSRWRRRTAVAAAADYFYSRRMLANAVSLAFCTVPLDRRGRDSDVTANLKQLIDGKWNLVLFAVGTRARDGRVGILRSGAAVLASLHNLPIVPIHISGTREAMPTGRRWMVRPEGERFARHTITVAFGAPIPPRPLEDRYEVMERVRLFMASCGADTTADPKLSARRAAAIERLSITAG